MSLTGMSSFLSRQMSVSIGGPDEDFTGSEIEYSSTEGEFVGTAVCIEQVAFARFSHVYKVYFTSGPMEGELGAAKILTTGYSHTHDKARVLLEQLYQREVRALSMLNHPNVIRGGPVRVSKTGTAIAGEAAVAEAVTAAALKAAAAALAEAEEVAAFKAAATESIATHEGTEGETATQWKAGCAAEEETLGTWKLHVEVHHHHAMAVRGRIGPHLSPEGRWAGWAHQGPEPELGLELMLRLELKWSETVVAEARACGGTGSKLRLKLALLGLGEVEVLGSSRRVIMLEWMHGGDARTLLDQAMRPMDPQAADSLILPLALALEAAHKWVRLADWGISVPVEEAASRMSTGGTRERMPGSVGTEFWCAPEIER
ncbi:hypothetical protein QJQ45_023027, partial [Haematococcus lacustris]